MPTDIKFWYDTLAWVRRTGPSSWWTVRDRDEWDFEPGMRLRLLNEGGEEIGHATVDVVGDFTVESWCRFDPEGHRSYPRASSLVGTLSRAYPEKDWQVGSPVVGAKMDPYTLYDAPNENYHAPPDVVEDRRER